MSIYVGDQMRSQEPCKYLRWRALQAHGYIITKINPNFAANIFQMMGESRKRRQLFLKSSPS